MRRIASVLAGMVLAAGCGVNDGPWPGSEGSGDDAYAVTVELKSVNGLEPNTPVRVDNVNVGTLTGIKLKGWHAVATLRLNREVELPENTLAKVGQASLLGSKYLELQRPAVPRGKLSAGDTIPLHNSGTFPETEDVLASASLLLNGGGLENVRTVVNELNEALDGRAGKVRATLTRLNTFMAGLDNQKADIVRAVRGLDRLAKQAAGHKKVITKTLRQVPPALQALEEERGRLTRALKSLSAFSDSSVTVLNQATGPLRRNLDNIAKVLKSLADAGDSLVGATGILASGPFPLKVVAPEYRATSPVRGDFTNLYVTVDLTNKAINDYYLTLVKDVLSKGVKVKAGPSRSAGLLVGPLLPEDKDSPDLPPALPQLELDTKDPVGSLLGGLLGKGGGQ